MAEDLRRKNEEAAKNLEKFHRMQEEERLRIEEDTFLKSILFIL